MLELCFIRPRAVTDDGLMKLPTPRLPAPTPANGGVRPNIEPAAELPPDDVVAAFDGIGIARLDANDVPPPGLLPGLGTGRWFGELVADWPAFMPVVGCGPDPGEPPP